jgi:hypothetical protein
MTTADITTSHAHAPAAAATSHPGIWATAVIGGVMGMISGLAQYNQLFSGRPSFLFICFYTFGGAALGIGIGAAAGFLWTKMRGRG